MGVFGAGSGGSLGGRLGNEAGSALGRKIGGKKGGKLAGKILGGTLGAVGRIGGTMAGAMIPGFKNGGKVKETGLAYLHKNEHVLPAGVKLTQAQKKVIADKKKKNK